MFPNPLHTNNSAARQNAISDGSGHEPNQSLPPAQVSHQYPEPMATASTHSIIGLNALQELPAAWLLSSSAIIEKHTRNLSLAIEAMGYVESLGMIANNRPDDFTSEGLLKSDTSITLSEVTEALSNIRSVFNPRCNAAENSAE